MSNLFGGQPKVIPEFTGLQVNTSVQVLPIPIIYGSPRVSINLIYYNGFAADLVNSQSGKGILGGGKGNKQVEYFATIIMGISEGPVGLPMVIYQDQEVWTPATYPTNGTVFFNGESGQAPWDYIVDTWPTDARPYPSTAYYGFPNAELDSSATVPQIDLVIQGGLYASSPLNYSTISITSGQYDPNGNPLSFIGDILLGNADADPAQVILDFLTNPTYGAGFPIEYIDQSTLLTSANGYDENVGDTALSTFCQAVGLAWSVVVNNAEGAGQKLDRWCKNLNTAIVWNGSMLRFLPYWDAPASGNPGYYATEGAIPLKYFTPYTTAICTIPLEQVIQSESKDEDPITFSRKDPWEIYNTVRVDFMDRTNFFNSNPVEQKDEALVELYGPRVDNIGQADEFTLLPYAATSAMMQLRRNTSIRRNFTWKMGPLWAWIDPMDIFNIPDPTNYGGTVLVRITSVTDDEDENITLEAEEFPVGSQAPTIIPLSPTTPPNQGATNSPPGNINPPVMIATPLLMYEAQGKPNQQWIFGATESIDGVLSGNWGGCNIWVSLDNVSYQLLGTQTGAATVGSLTESLSSYPGSNPDNTDVLSVNLAISDGSLASVSAAAAAAGNTICCIVDVSGFEILSYTTATLVSADTWQLTGLYRGLYGTTPRFFGAGSQFLFLGTGANYFETSVLPGYIGEDFYVKAQSFNVFNSATQELSDCVAYRYTLTGTTPVGPSPPPPAAPAVKSVLTRRQTIASTPSVGRKPRPGPGRNGR